MRKIYSLLIFMLSGSALYAQTFAVDTVLKNGPVAERINLVFLGDGYTAGEQTKFIADVKDILVEMFSQSPFKAYKSYFNAYAVKVISAESGANHPQNTADSDCAGVPQMVVNNYFGSTFDYNGIHRLLYPADLSKVVNVLIANFPLYDQGFIVVNTPYYGGAGGTFATCSVHPNGKDVAMHEIGHSFAGLADEYWAGAGFAAEKPNMTRQTDPALVKWKNWIGVSGVGIYSHSGDASWKKPHTNCKMGVLGVPLCKVCSETFVERFHLFVKPLAGFSPQDTRFNIDPEAEQDLTFSLSLVPPDPNTLKITWEKDNITFAKNMESTIVSSLDLAASSTIRATVIDTTNLTRAESHILNHTYILEWEITKSNVVTGVEVTSRKYELAVYPNPAENDLKFSYTLSKPTPVIVFITDSNGRKIRTLVNAKQENGAHNYTFDRRELGIPPGAYTIQFDFGKTNVPVKVLLR